MLLPSTPHSWLKCASDSLVTHARHLRENKAKGDDEYSSIITAESLVRDEDVLTVELENRKHIKTVVI